MWERFLSLINSRVVPIKAAVNVHGPGIVSVKSGDLLRSRKGMMQIDALRRISLKRDTP